MTVHVFLGPSLPVSEGKKLLRDAVFHPPAAMGDIYSAVTGGAQAIGLIDGLFDCTPSVWHKEILFALARGVRMVAGGSMGALRGAETHVYGTEGVGQSFAWFRDGVLEDDDEVAVAHATAADGYRPLSDAMVTLRWGLARARRRRLISDATHDRLIKAAKARYYPERGWGALLGDGAQLGLPEKELGRLRDFVKRERPDLKREDAIAVLRALARKGHRPPRPAPEWDFEPTEFWHKLVDAERWVVRSRTLRPEDDLVIRLRDLVTHTMLTAPDRDELRERALDLALRSAELERQRVPVDAGAVDQHSRRRSAKSALLPAGEWRLASELELATPALVTRMDGRYVRYLQLALAQMGRLDDALAEIRDKHEYLRARGLPRPGPADTGLTARGLLRWYERRFGRIRGSAHELATSLGFSSEDHFLSELAGDYLYDRDVRTRRGRRPRGSGDPARKRAAKPRR